MAQIRDFYSDVDLKANQLFNSRLHNITTADRITLGLSLTVLSKGYQVYDIDLLSPYFWDGVQWASAGGGGGGTNPTDTYIPYNNAGIFADSYLINDVANKTLKTFYQGNNVGLTIDFNNYYYSLGDVSSTFPNFINGSTVELLTANSLSKSIIYFTLDGSNESISGGYNGIETGLKLDFANNIYKFGDYNDINNHSKLIIDDN